VCASALADGPLLAGKHPRVAESGGTNVCSRSNQLAGRWRGPLTWRWPLASTDSGTALRRSHPNWWTSAEKSDAFGGESARSPNERTPVDIRGHPALGFVISRSPVQVGSPAPFRINQFPPFLVPAISLQRPPRCRCASAADWSRQGGPPPRDCCPEPDQAERADPASRRLLELHRISARIASDRRRR
jgi:hypothetical protein